VNTNCARLMIRTPAALLKIMNNITPDPLFFLGFILCVIFLLGIVKIIIDIIHSLRRKPPLEDEFAKKGELEKLEITTKHELSKLELAIGSMREEMRANYDRVNSNDEIRSSKIHRRIDDVFGAVSEVKGIIKNVPCLRGAKPGCTE